MKLIYLKKSLLLIFIFYSVFLIGNNQDIQFKKYGIKEGFSDISFREIIQDKKGFLWFATLNGVNRFDGRNVKVYRAESDNSHSISYNKISAIYEDSYGYIWIFTYDRGLMRLNPENENIVNITQIVKEKYKTNYEALQFVNERPGIIWIISRTGGLLRISENENNDKINIKILNINYGLPSNTVRFLHTDKNNVVWIGTDAGLVKLDSIEVKTEKNSNWFFYSKENKTGFTCFCEQNNEIWFGTTDFGIMSFNLNSYLLKHVDAVKTKGIIRSISRGKNKDILVTTQGDGIFYKYFQNNNFIHLAPLTKRGDIVDLNYYRVYCDNYGLFWLEGQKRGVTLFDPRTESIKYYGLNPQIRESAGDPDDPIFHEDSNGELWIGLDGGGICRLNRKTMDFEQFFHDPSNPGSISSNLVICLFEDNDKNLWIGTYQGGLNKVELVKYPFNYVKPVKDPLFQSYNEVRALTIDKYDRIWIGTKEGHIYCYDKNYKLIYTFPNEIENSNNYSINNVYDLIADISGNLWLGTKGHGVYIIKGIVNNADFKNKEFEIINFQMDVRNPSRSISHNEIYSIYQDNIGQIWIGCFNGGLNVIKNINNISFDKYYFDLKDTNSISDNRIRYIMQDSKNNLWICTINGLNLLQSKYISTPNKKFIRFNKPAYNIKSNLVTDVICVYEDSKGRIWSGTYGSGLKLLHYDSITFKYSYETFLLADGLPSEIILAIEEDKNGNLWLATDNGLCKFNYETKMTENYIDEEGIGDNLFSEGVGSKNSEGKIFFGHKKGFISFYPDSVKKDTLSYNLWITELKILNKTMKAGTANSPLSKSIESTKSITLKHNQNFLEIKYAILDYVDPERCQYHYMMEGIDQDWVYAGNRQSATYTNIEPGKYLFKVEAANHDGFWTSNEAILLIKIKPPYYKTWGFRLFIIFLILGSGIVYYYIRVNSLKKQKAYLEQLVKKRTKEIETKNLVLEKQTTELKERHVFIEKQSNELKKQKLELEKSNNELHEINTLMEERQQKVEEQSEELKVQAEELEEKNADLYKLNATKDKLFSIISHDLKNPFNSILGFTKILLDKYGNMDDTKKIHLIQIINNSAKGIYSLLDNLLQWSRSQIGSLSFHPINIDLKETINENIRLVNSMLEQKNIKANNNVGDNIMVLADENMLNTVIRNIITNSIKFTENGEINIFAFNSANKITIEIQDTGVGIQPDKLEIIFEIERSKLTEGTKGEQGSGLGLLLCKEFVRKNGGEIYAKSQPGKGSIIGFTLPAGK